MIDVQVIWSTATQEPSTPASVVFTLPAPITGDDLAICEALFHDTNVYAGELWDAMQPLPEDRTHTALSVGDYVRVADRMYVCLNIGWAATDDFIPGLAFGEHPTAS